MFCSLKRQNITRKAVGLVLCLLIIGLTLFFQPPSVAAQNSAPSGAEQGLVSATWHTASSAVKKTVAWTVAVWSKATNWVKEQGSQIARAVVFWRYENQVDLLLEPSEPQVLGEEAESPPALVVNNQSPIATPTPSPVILKPAPVRPITPVPRVKERVSTPVIKKQAQPAPVVVPPRVPEIKKEAAPVPVAESTPDILLDPAPTQPSGQSYIPILARDTIAPTSAVTAFAAASTATPGSATSSPFTVAWSGQDTDITAPGAVSSFDIQYQVDSGEWQDWLAQTVLLSDLFTGQDEKNYGFRSRSRDRYGNLESYPDSADASIYSNLSMPTTPTVTSHTTGGTVLNTTADEDTSSGSTVQVTLSGSGDIGDILTITLAETDVTATTTIANAAPRWSKQFTLAEGANNFTLQTQESDGDNSLSASFVLNLEMVPTREVVINEIAWMGTRDSGFDEWIEFYNASSTAISLESWVLTSSDNTPNFTISYADCANTTVAAKSYFLLERTDDTTINNVAADCFYTGSLGDDTPGELLTLRDDSGLLIDKAGSSTVVWFAGDNSSVANRATMERKDPTADGTLASNWATNDGTFINGQDNGGNNIKGTPKSLNSVNTTIPRPITDLQVQFIYTTTTSVRLYWTAPNNTNLATTTPATYQVSYYQQSGGDCLTTLTSSNFSDGTLSNGTMASLAQGTVATSTISGLQADTAYCFAVKTSNGFNDSSMSNVYTASTNPAGYGTQLAGIPGGVTPTLTLAGSPYLLAGSIGGITIPSGTTLTIQPGVVLKMKHGTTGCGSACSIAVQGNLVIGSSSDNINGVVITSERDDTYAGDTNGDGSATAPSVGSWNRIIMSTGTATITANNSIIRYGGSGGAIVQLSGGTTAITRSIIEMSSGYAISIGGASTELSLSNSTIRNNLDGIGVSSNSDINIQGSTFTGNRRGITIAGGSGTDEGSIHIGDVTGNNFYANNTVSGGASNAGLEVTDDSDGIPVVAQSNWWGSVSGPTLDSHSTANDRDGVIDNNDGSLDANIVDIDSYHNTSAFEVLPSNL